MKERNYLIVIFANIAVIKKVKLENTLLPFMKEKSYLNVTNVITSVIIRNKHVEAIHKGNKPLECEFCGHNFSENSAKNKHI